MPAKAPIIRLDIINDDMNVLGFLTQGLNKGIGDILANLLFLRFCNAVKFVNFQNSDFLTFPEIISGSLPFHYSFIGQRIARWCKFA